MPESSLENERRRLAELYAGISDHELEQFASDADSLKQVAREMLRAELSRRGLKIELRNPIANSVANAEHAARGELVTLRRFRDPPEALLAQCILNSADIECFLGDENMVRLDWFWSNLVGGIKLWVRQEDASTAAELLAENVPEEFEVNGVGKYQQPRCPACASFDVSFEELNKRVAFTTAWLVGMPIGLKRHGWRCHSCWHQWKESDAAPA
jgi:hypothetical protein